MRITTKGQVTIPQDIRDRLGFLPHTEVQFRVDGEVAVLEKVNGASLRGQELIRRLQGSATTKMTTDEILALTRDMLPARTRPVPLPRPRRRQRPARRPRR